MKRVGIREFRDNATKYLAGNEALTIERHGEPIGVYIPTGADRAARQARAAEAMARLEQTIERILAETGWTEDELSQVFDLSIPESELVIPERRTPSKDASSHAADR
jgi:antitoxin (DNA-binding transcriptional repressor) of toxin-antitoxin stability system